MAKEWFAHLVAVLPDGFGKGPARRLEAELRRRRVLAPLGGAVEVNAGPSLSAQLLFISATADPARALEEATAVLTAAIAACGGGPAEIEAHAVVRADALR